MRTTSPFFVLFFTAAGLLASSTPAEFLPPALPWHGASESLIAQPNNPWITPSEKTDLTDSPGYDETIAWLKKLSAASPVIRLQRFGTTAQGRPLYVVIASKEGRSSFEIVSDNGRPTLLAQAGIHSGEIDGKDAGLMLLRDIAFGGKAALLERANFLFIPVLNADGHERTSEWNRPNQRGPVHQGWRTTAQNLNLNRDYMKADSPEMTALLILLQHSHLSLYLDLHVTDGIDYQYDITYGFNGWDGGFAWSPAIGAWLDKTLRPALDSALKTAGHIPGPLVFSVNGRDLSDGLSRSPANPRFSQGHGDLRHIPSVLVENHSLKPYKQRVLGTYVLLETSLKVIGERAAALRTAIATDAASRPALIPINWNGNPDAKTSMDFAGIACEDYDSPASGRKEVRWLGTPKIYQKLPLFLTTKPGLELRRPKAYWVPVTNSAVIDRLVRQGLRIQRLDKALTRSFEMDRLVRVKVATEPFEGHYTLTAGVKPETRTETFPAGSVRISTDQPLGDLAVALLEPESNDSLLSWGFFPEILQRTEYIEGYVVAPMAEKMLAEDPQLKVDFEAKLASDDSFAKNPTARLEWFYARSKFYDERYLLYPIGIER